MPDPFVHGALPAELDLNQTVRRGGRIIVLTQVASHIVSLAVVSILLHLIEPAAYGLVGMVFPVCLLIRQGMTWGLNVAAIQRAELSAADSSNLFWLNVGLGTAATIAMTALAPLLALFNAEPELRRITVVLAGSMIVIALGTQHQALLDRRLKLGAVAISRLVAQIAAGFAAIAAAMADWHVWALVVQQYVELGTMTFLCWRLEPWRPDLPRRGLGFHRLAAFGGYFAGGSLMLSLMVNLDKILVGYLLGKEALGLYGQAFGLAMRPVTAVTVPAGGAMLPALTRVAGDQARFCALLTGSFRLTAFLLLPVGAGLFLVGEQALPLLGGPKWIEAAPLLVALSLTILVQGFINLSGSVLAARGHADRFFFGAILLALVLYQGLAAGYWFGRQFGAAEEGPLLGIAWAYSLTLLICSGPYFVYVLRSADVPLAACLKAIAPSAQATAMMGLCVWLARRALQASGYVPTLWAVFVEIVVGVLVYALLARRELLWMLARPSVTRK